VLEQIDVVGADDAIAGGGLNGELELVGRMFGGIGVAGRGFSTPRASQSSVR